MVKYANGEHVTVSQLVHVNYMCTPTINTDLNTVQEIIGCLSWFIRM